MSMISLETFMPPPVLPAQGGRIRRPRHIYHDESTGGAYHDKIPPYLLHLQGFLQLAREYEVIGVEIYAEEHHENGDDPLDIGRIITAAAVFYAETAGSRRSECDLQGFQKRQPSGEQEDELNDRHDDIDDIKDAGRLLYLGNKLAHDRAGALRLHDVHF